MSGTKSAATKHVAAAEATAMKGWAAPETAAVKGRPAAEAATASMETTMTTAMTASAMATANFSDQSVGNGVRGRHRTWIDRRQRFCAMA
jgi:hypothetical protein